MSSPKQQHLAELKKYFVSKRICRRGVEHHHNKKIALYAMSKLKGGAAGGLGLPEPCTLVTEESDSVPFIKCLKGLRVICLTGRERIIKALRRQPTDRIPVVNFFHQSYTARELGIKGPLVNKLVQDPQETMMALQRKLKHDPLINLYTFKEPEIITWPEAILRWAPEDRTDWVIEETLLRHDDGKPVIKRVYHTPKGDLQAVYRKDAYQKWVLEPILKEETEAGWLNFRPAPEKLDTTPLREYLAKLKGEAFTLLDIRGSFDELCGFRGLTETLYDLYDHSDKTKATLASLRDYTVRLVKKLGTTGIDGILLNESAVGTGLSPKAFLEFVLPYDQVIAEAAKEAGLLVSYHICGKSNKLLELMAESGADAIETLAPPEVSGDCDLAQAKKRVGDRVALWGGFNERVLAAGDRQLVKREVHRCLSAAAEGGGYILRGAGQIYEATPEAWDAFTEAVEEFQS
ncbi:uroporphyrinogen decarboxylase [Peptococcaceae bacterium CEB3]|nr:uroporphyrinogen decarboxylase [Peptococcaceae bacterium CEB3]